MPPLLAAALDQLSAAPHLGSDETALHALDWLCGSCGLPTRLIYGDYEVGVGLIGFTVVGLIEGWDP